MHHLRFPLLAAASLFTAFTPAALFAAPPAASTQPAPTTNTAFTEAPDVIIESNKVPQNQQTAPFSVTRFEQHTIDAMGAHFMRDASIASPNTYLNDFSARKLSNPFIRGIGNGPTNPGVTTYYDGVPQLNGSTSSRQFLDIGAIEFARGSFSSLYGRNTLGGVVNAFTTPPAEQMSAWLEGSYGNYNFGDVRAGISGPINDHLSFGLSAGFQSREGYAENVVTGHDVDSKEAWFSKAQLVWQGGDGWTLRLIASGETANDGDYALEDLDEARFSPHRVATDFEGYTKRNFFDTTFIAQRQGSNIDFISITGFLRWETSDRTDLDYSPFPILGRGNDQNATQVTQEFRFSSAQDVPVRLTDDITMRWQAGVFGFYEDSEQHAFTGANLNFLNFPDPPFFVDFPQLAAVETYGASAYFQTIFTYRKWDFYAGGRYDFEHLIADAFDSTPALIPPPDGPLAPIMFSGDEDFHQFSPMFALDYRATEDLMTYVSFSRGYKAGGFNASSPADENTFDAESAWTTEIGVKTRWLNNRLFINAAVFYIDWEDMQLNVPNPGLPGQFFVDNVGAAISKGVEAEFRYVICPSWDVFGGFSYTDAQFRAGSEAMGADITGNRLPHTPHYTVNIGTEVRHRIGKNMTIYGRAEMVAYGSRTFDESDTERQDDYNLVNFRAGIRGPCWFIEGWVNNAFDTDYIQIALPYDLFTAPSGFIAESGPPVTFGITAGFRF